MNNAKIWLVVPPAVGVPVFLGAVAVGSFAVHVAVVSNTGWVDDFISGQELGSTAQARMLEATDDAIGHASYVMPAADGGQEVLVLMPDGTTATAVLQTAPTLASAAAVPRTDF